MRCAQPHPAKVQPWLKNISITYVSDLDLHCACMYKHMVADYDHALGPVKPQVKPLVKLQNNIKCQHLLSSNQMNERSETKNNNNKIFSMHKNPNHQNQIYFPFVEVRNS